MQVVDKPLTSSELKKLSLEIFGNFVKAVVDVEKQTMAVNAELHADLEAFMVENGSKSQNLWGINIYPDLAHGEMVEFDSMINLKPSLGNMSRNVVSTEIRQKILKVVNKLVK